MSMKKYNVKCKQCQNSDNVIIDEAENKIYWENNLNIISGRYRLDMQWGWQCKCGNNDIITKQEGREISNLQSPDPADISKVLKSLIPDKPKFAMVES